MVTVTFFITIIILTPHHEQALTTANYIIKPFFPDCENPDDAVRLLAAAAICKVLKIDFIVT